MTSLRRLPLRSPWLTLALVGAGSAAATFVVSRQETNSLLDCQMQRIATFIGAQSFSPASTSGVIPTPNIDHEMEDGYVVGVRDNSGKILYASRTEIAREIARQLGGQVQLENRADPSGLIAHVQLPRAIDSQRELSLGTRCA